MTANFTKRKFLNFSLQQQHKKCAEILRCLYESCLSGNVDNTSLNSYNQICTWMDLPHLNECTIKIVADRYHEHAKQALLHHKEHRLLPQSRCGDKKSGATPWNLSIYLDNIRSAHNVGSIIRTTEAFSLGKIFFSDATPFASHKQVKDAAMGCDQWVDCIRDIPFSKLPKPLIALETANTALPLFDYTFPAEFTLAVGNEEYGCSEEILNSADVILEIPLRGRKNSLNVANAFAIAAAEISRQRTGT